MPNKLGELARLLGQRMTGGGGFLDHGGVLLRDEIHLPDRLVDLLQRRRLLICAYGDVGHRRIDLGHLFGDAL